MAAVCSQRILITLAVIGICFIILGVVLVTQNILIARSIQEIHRNGAITKGSPGRNLWLRPVNLQFKCYLFHVSNPEAVAVGEAPIFIERGPYVYEEILERIVISEDEETDEISYMMRTSFQFNRVKSGNATEDDQVTILNPAYLGTINLLVSLPPNFMIQYGDHIAKLFPDQKSIFVTAKAGAILFNGVKFTCNSKKYPELDLVCSTLESNKPPIVLDGPKPGQYVYSFFQRRNNTLEGSYRISRGTKTVKDMYTITQYRGKRVQRIWETKECNTVRGTDTMSYSPIFGHQPFVTTFIADLCRTIELAYQHETIVTGIKGSLYTTTNKMWDHNEIECYCPVVDGEMKCPPKGILDIGQCQGIPILQSEPHFLHGDPELLQYARGLKPKESINAHSTFVVIEPITGTPLSGMKRTQLNMKLSKQPVELLANVSEGYFPLVWCEEGVTVEVPMIPETVQGLRVFYMVWYLQMVPVIIGIYILLVTLYLFEIPNRKSQTNRAAEFMLVQSDTYPTDLIRKPPKRPRRVFE